MIVFLVVIWSLKMNIVRIVFLFFVSLSSFVTSLLLLMWDISYFIEWEVLSLNSCYLSISLIIDNMSIIFISFVILISSIVLFYRGGYIAEDININRFIYLVLIFVIRIVLLIISPNIIRILLGWDGLGLVSYALVIYYQNEKSASAGILTALSNRVGDVCILLRIALIFNLGSWNFFFYVRERLRNQSGLIMLVVLAAITKSAQIPFSAWLPAAIAAPTPVSALVHSSTLVTAGVYLLIRFSSALRGTFEQSCLLLIASLTIFMAGLGANFETDLKKIIALSTLSQLGVMMVILSIGLSELAFFHLLAHALFKSLLFICAGSIIHSVGDYQDIRIIGGMINYIPLRVSIINLANLALCGAPFLAGFYSKDLILEVAYISIVNEVCFWLLVLATGLTVCYTLRLIYYRLSGDFNLAVNFCVDDNNILITWPILVLGFMSVVGGATLSWLLFPSPFIICLSPFFKILTLLVCILGGLVGYKLNDIKIREFLKSLSSYKLVLFSGSIWFIPLISTRGVRPFFLRTGKIYSSRGDSGWREYYGGQGVYHIFIENSKLLQKLQDNNIKLYIISLITWIFILFVYYLYLSSLI